MSRVALLLLLAALGGCSGSTVAIKPDYRLPQRLMATAPSVSIEQPACLDFIDSRSNTTSWYKDLSTDDARLWVDTALARISNNVVSLGGSKEPEHTAGLSIELQKAYVKHMTTSMSGVVVFTLKSPDYTGVFRGQAVKNNWWGATSEFEAVLNEALHQALSKVFDDVDATSQIEQASCRTALQNPTASLQ